MKKITLVLIGVLALALFLVGCAQEEIEVVDEQGNVVGEAFRSAGKLQIKATSYCDTLSDCGYVTKEDVYAILADTWGTINNDHEYWSCADTCRENSVDGNGKCIAGFGFDSTNRIMKDVMSCNIKQGALGASTGVSGYDLVCLCTG